MSEVHNHDHDAVDTVLVKRLRFVKLALDGLLLPDNPNREQSYIAAVRMLEIIGVDTANQPASEAMNGWVYAKELVAAMEPDITAELHPDEVTQFYLRVEALSGQPLDGREELWKAEQEKLNELSKEKPVVGLIRLLVLTKRLIKRRARAFTTLGLKPEQLLASQHLILKDLDDWKKLELKPHWFTDEFLLFRESDEERTNLHEDVVTSKLTKEEELMVKLFMIRHESPEGINLVRFYKKKLDATPVESDSPQSGVETDAETNQS